MTSILTDAKKALPRILNINLLQLNYITFFGNESATEEFIVIANYIKNLNLFLDKKKDK